MIKTKHIVLDITQVPREWVFEHYLNLEESLTGQDVKIKSVFNSKDTRPSLIIYWDQVKNYYVFKDYSADKSGDAIRLVKELFNLHSRSSATRKIIDDYGDYILNGGEKFILKEFKVRSKYKVKSVTPRHWNVIDKKYWMKYRIDSNLLEKFNVQPLEAYTLYRDDTEDMLEIKGQLMFGYFSKNNTLYKIYTPNLKTRFFKVKDHIQGMDQLTYDVPYLVICSSMKDLLTFHKLGFTNAECIAPDSENTLIPESVINTLKEKYKKVCTIFDNDEPGLRAMQKYEKKFNLPYAHLMLEKDLSDSIEQHGIRNTRFHLYPILTKALTGTTKNLPI
jgi:hypothetical protein